MAQPFTTSWRVRFDEIDMQGVVHHPQIVTYLEVARLEFWRSLGISYGELREDGYEYIVHDLHVEYLKPLDFDEIIEVAVRVKTLGRASFVLGYEIFKGTGALAVKAEIELVCARVGVARPVALPEKYRSKLEKEI
jgi:acyl-CoA thioester hydrolase